jgi:tetratricopeptide (TPR) repeat protein
VLAKLYFDTGNKYYMHKQHPTAMLYMEKAAKIYEAASGAESPEMADTYEGIASIYINLKDNKKSLDYAQKCLDIRKKKLKAGDEATKRAQMNVDYLKEELKKEK